MKASKLERIKNLTNLLKLETDKIEDTSDLEFKQQLEDKISELNEIIEAKKDESISQYYFNLLAENYEQYERNFVTIPDPQKFHFGPKDEKSLFLWISNNKLNKLTHKIDGFPNIGRVEYKRKPSLLNFNTDFANFKFDTVCTSFDSSFDIQNNNDQIYYYIYMTPLIKHENYQDLQQVLLDLVDFLDDYYLEDFKLGNQLD